MSNAKSKLCGLVRSQNCVGKEKPPPTEKSTKRYQSHKKVKSRKPRREKYGDSLSSCSSCSSCSSEDNLSRNQAPNNHVPLRRRPQSSRISGALKSWPPSGYTKFQTLSPSRAEKLISMGAPIFRGHRLPVTIAGKDYCHLFATISGNKTQESDGRVDRVYEAASLRLHGSGLPVYPWETLEQPSMAFCNGSRPGTVRLNHWVNLNSKLDKSTKILEEETKIHDLTLSKIIDRLIQLEEVTTIDTDDLKGKSSQEGPSYIPTTKVNPHKTNELQISDFVKDLSRPSWIDFSKKENQVVAAYFANATYTDEAQYKLFFHQLLLSLELDLRMQSFSSEANLEILKHLPEKVKWDLALSRIWRRNIRIESHANDNNHDRIHFDLRSKKEQLRKLREFAMILQWPTFSSLAPIFSGSFKEIEDYSTETISYFTAVILPGPSLPFLLMNSLIDIDPSSSSNLEKLKHEYPNTGFQYRDVTYWTSNCIIGKVLAPTCKEVGGWIGPIRPAVGLQRNQVALIHQRKPKWRLEESDVKSMSERSLPLGPTADQYPINDYILLDTEIKQSSIIDTIRVEKLSMWPAPSSVKDEGIKPQTFDASIQFSYDGASWPMALKYNVTFVSACSCYGGPHPIFYDYEHQAVRVDEILQINDWAERSAGKVLNYKLKGYAGSMLEKITSENATGQLSDLASTSSNSRTAGCYDEKVLVIEAYGVPDNEVLARSWCAHWGLNAVIADIHKICMSCAIREAFAACLNVLILVDGSSIGGKDCG